MALINFPVSPSVNQTFTLGSKTWIWNGYAWDLQLVNVAPIYNAANSAGAFANAAFSKANNSLQLSGSASQTVTSNVTISGSLTVTGNVNISGNVNQITGNSGQFFGNTAGFGALYAGVATGYLLEPQIVTQITSNFNGYAGGINMQNINSGSNASSDLFISADNGTLYDGFSDFGLGSSTYSYSGYTLIGPNDGYWIVTGNTITGGGNAIISTGLSNDIIFAQNGTNIESEVARFKYNAGLVFKSNGITFADGTKQNTAAAPYGYSNAAYSQANNISSYANAQIAIIQGVDASQNANITSAQAFANAAYAQANAATFTVSTVYDLDDISFKSDGFTNTFNLSYNQTAVSIPSPFNLMVTVNGLVQPAFDYKYDTVWLANVLTSSKGYTIDISGNPTTNGYIKFADCPPQGSQILMRTVVGNVQTTKKVYPFKPLDVMMGY